MPDTFPITGLIHHLAPEQRSPPSRSCQEKPPFPAAGCHGNPSLRIPSQHPASALDHAIHHRDRGCKQVVDKRPGGPQERHPTTQPSTGTHGSTSQDAHPGQQDADDGSMPLVKRARSQENLKSQLSPPPPPAPTRNLTCC